MPGLAPGIPFIRNPLLFFAGGLSKSAVSSASCATLRTENRTQESCNRNWTSILSGGPNPTFCSRIWPLYFKFSCLQISPFTT